jgi:tripeptide aminopeptidase
MQLMAIPGPSGREGAVAQFVVEQLRAAGAQPEAIEFDEAHRRTPLAGEVGNLILKLPGTFRGPRRLLMAHLDTVPLCVGARPVRRGEFVCSADPNVGLGADDRAGVAVVLSAAVEILKRGLPYPPLTFFWSVQEEIGLYGARFAQARRLGRPKLAFNFDGGGLDKITVGATGGYRVEIVVHGLASHAGVAPEKGVNAITIASLAIAQLHRDGWLGNVRRSRRHGTSNLGVIEGGAATNVVTDRVRIRGEARSHDPQFRQRVVRAIEKAFHQAARQVRNDAGVAGRVEFHGRLDYEAFRLSDDDSAVQAAEAAVRSVGIEPQRAISNGGLDANWMTAHGVPTVTLGCGQVNIHTVHERLDVATFEQACRVALRLATAREAG